MKKETYAQKMAALGLIPQELVDKAKSAVSAVTSKPKDKKAVTFEYVEEARIESYREAQAISYFLQAPKLFTLKTCPHCKQDFYVSRNFVKFCSHTCIKKDFEERGILWEKGNDLEALANDPEVWNGNEPLQFKNIEGLKAALEVLTQSQSV